MGTANPVSFQAEMTTKSSSASLHSPKESESNTVLHMRSTQYGRTLILTKAVIRVFPFSVT